MISQHRYLSTAAAALLAFAAAVAIAPYAANAGALPYSYLTITPVAAPASAPGTSIQISNVTSDFSVALSGPPDATDAGSLQVPSGGDSQCGGSCGYAYENAFGLNPDRRFAGDADSLISSWAAPMNPSGAPATAPWHIAESNRVKPGVDRAPPHHGPSFPFNFPDPPGRFAPRDPGAPGIDPPSLLDPEIFAPANDVLDDPPGTSTVTPSLLLASVAEPPFPGIFGVLALLAGLYLRRRNRV